MKCGIDIAKRSVVGSLLAFILVLTYVVPCRASWDKQSVGEAESANLRTMLETQRQAFRDGNLDKAASIGKEALGFYRNGNTDSVVGKLIDLGGHASYVSRRYIDALELYLGFVKYGEASGRQQSVNIGLNNIGNIFEIFGDYERARLYYGRAYDNARASNDGYMIASSAVNLVNVNCQLGDLDSARRYYPVLLSENLHTREETLFWRLYARSAIAMAESKFTESISLCGEARKLAAEYGMPRDLVALLNDRIGMGYYALGRMDSVIDNSMRVVRDSTSTRLYPDLLANAYARLADAYALLGDNDSVGKYKFLSLQLRDSLLNRRRFNEECEKLMEYEDGKVQARIGSLNDRIKVQTVWIILIVVMLLAVAGILAVVYIGNVKLRKANGSLVRKNQDLLDREAENRQLRDQLAHIFEKDESEPVPADKGDEDKTPGQKQDPLTDRQRMVLLRDIERVMSDTEVITDPAFSLGELARRVHSNTTYVSAAINGTYRKNFKTYLNDLRIQIAARRLKEDSRLTIQAIAENSGFKSASNFVASFKRVMGMNPSDYRRYSS